MSVRSSTFARTALAVVILSVALSGCAGTPEDLSQATADRLQAGVRSLTTAASAGDFTSAQTALDSLQADLLDAASAGDVTGSRSAEIQSAINLVAADLDAASAAAIEAAKPTPTPTPTPTRDSKPGKGDNNDDDDKKGGKGKDD